MFYVFIKSNFIMFIILTTIYLDLILFCVFLWLYYVYFASC